MILYKIYFTIVTVIQPYKDVSQLQYSLRYQKIQYVIKDYTFPIYICKLYFMVVNSAQLEVAKGLLASYAELYTPIESILKKQKNLKVPHLKSTDSFFSFPSTFILLYSDLCSVDSLGY